MFVELQTRDTPTYKLQYRTSGWKGRWLTSRMTLVRVLPCVLSNVKANPRVTLKSSTSTSVLGRLWNGGMGTVSSDFLFMNTGMTTRPGCKVPLGDHVVALAASTEQLMVCGAKSRSMMSPARAR